jgi:hypothetical protein
MTSALDQRYGKSLAVAAFLSAAFVMPAQAQMSAALTGTAEFPAETAAIVQATAQLFDAVEAEAARRGSRPAIGRPVVLATPASVGANSGKTDILVSRGPVDHLTGYRINWYPVDRFLGSVDFMGTWGRNRNLVCGFVTWDMSNPKSPVLDSVEATFIDISDLSGEGPESIHAALLDANCAYGAIDANYAFFE